jgi:uncharacterized RDD family membrane protein YckC
VPPGAYAPRPERPGPPRQDDLAGFGRRLIAFVLDGIIIVGLSLSILAAIGAGFFGDDGSLSVGEIIAGLLLTFTFFAAIALLYAPAVMAATNGQTLGKWATGIRVVRADGQKVGFAWSVLREFLVKGVLLGVAGALTGGIAYLVDGVWPLVDGQNRALHDYIVDSRVVRA